MDATPIPAAALILRRAEDDDRLFLARRARRMRFFGGVYAFVGGRVDDADRQVGGDDPVVVLRSTVVREVCEELGLDLRTGAPRRGRVDDAVRRALLDGDFDWCGECAADALVDLGEPPLRLITPAFYPRRFDTWFFLHTLGSRKIGSLLEEELDDGQWDSVDGWLDRFDRGQLLLAPPTVITLRALRGQAWPDWPARLRALQDEVEGPAPQPIWNNPAVQLLALRTPTVPPARHTNTYVVGRDPAYVVDPAPVDAGEQAALELALRRVADDGRSLGGILLTHHHRDHVGAVEFVRERFGLTVAAHAETAARVDFRVDRTLEHAETIDLGVAPDGRDGWSLQCHFTPGHAPGHLAFTENRYGSLIAGDMVSTLSSILIHPDDGDLGRYLQSLRYLATLDVEVVYPSHGPADARGTKALTDQIAHRETRSRSVLDAVRSGVGDVAGIVDVVYTDVPLPMHGLAADSVRSILIDLARRGEVVRDGDRVRSA